MCFKCGVNTVWYVYNYICREREWVGKSEGKESRGWMCVCLWGGGGGGGRRDTQSETKTKTEKDSGTDWEIPGFKLAICTSSLQLPPLPSLPPSQPGTSPTQSTSLAHLPHLQSHAHLCKLPISLTAGCLRHLQKMEVSPRYRGTLKRQKRRQGESLRALTGLKKKKKKKKKKRQEGWGEKGRVGVAGLERQVGYKALQNMGCEGSSQCVVVVTYYSKNLRSEPEEWQNSFTLHMHRRGARLARRYVNGGVRRRIYRKRIYGFDYGEHRCTIRGSPSFLLLLQETRSSIVFRAFVTANVGHQTLGRPSRRL